MSEFSNTNMAPSTLDEVPRALRLNLREHRIEMVIPPGCVLNGGVLKLHGGVLIQGAVRGRIQCASGSAIIAAGAEFQGWLEADNIYVAGLIRDFKQSESAHLQKSQLRARVRRLDSGESVGGAVVIVKGANVSGELIGHRFDVNQQANMTHAIMRAETV